MGMRQRKDKGDTSRKESPTAERARQEEQKSAGAESPATGNRTAAESTPVKSSRGSKDFKSKNVFARAASLDVSEEDEPLVWSASSGPQMNAAADQMRIQKEKERKRAKKEERARANRQDTNNKQKKGQKGTSVSGLLQNISASDFRSRITSWLMYLLVATAILGIFVLKALEEYYGLDGDVSGETRLQHLAVLGLEDGATESDIRRSYRTLSIRWHPDRNTNCGASCQQRFHEVAAAYEYLMRQQRKAKMDEENAESTKGDDTSGLKVTSQGIVDFSGLRANDAFPPTTDTKHVWSVMVHQDKDEWSQSVYEMWQESSRALGKYVKFGVITVRGRIGKDALKKLPINVKFYPAILLLTAGMHPEQYAQISRPSVESINRFIADAFPSSVDVVSSAAALGSWLASSPLAFSPQAAQYKAVIIASGASSSSPSLLVKHAAFSNKQTFSFCFLANARSVLASQKEELLNVLRNPPTWLRQLPADSAAAKALKLPVQSDELREELLTSSSAVLFVDEGRGVSRAQATLHTLRTKLLNPSTPLALAMDRFKEVIHPFLYQQNSALLCKSSLQKRVFCLVAVEPAEDKTEGSGATENQTLDVAHIKSLLQLSKQKYLTENPRKNLETIWEQAIEKAKEYERAHHPRGEDEMNDSSTSTKEPDDVHIEQPDDVEEEIIHVQVVRVSVGTPLAVPGVPALTASSMFPRLLKEELNDAPLFLLDLEGSRVAAVPPLFVGDMGASRASTENFYKQLYQKLDELQMSLDDDSDSRPFFSALPEYCSGSNFAKKCLASEQRSWWWRLMASWSLLQVALLAAVGVATFMFWNKLTAEMFLAGMLLLSLAIGACSTIQPVFNFLFGGQ